MYNQSMKLHLQPITKSEADEFIRQFHRHHKPSVGWKFGLAVTDGEKVVGVVVCGRPVARSWDDGWTIEVTRCCTDGTPNACSKLYGAAWRAARALGYKRMITYTLAGGESGASLRASNFKVLHEVRGRSWSCPSRPRVDTTSSGEDKLCWGVGLFD